MNLKEHAKIYQSQIGSIDWTKIAAGQELFDSLYKKLSRVVHIPSIEGIEGHQSYKKLYLPDQQVGQFIPTVSYLEPTSDKRQFYRIEVPLLGIVGERSFGRGVTGKIISARWRDQGEIFIRYPGFENMGIKGAEKSTYNKRTDAYTVSSFGSVKIPILNTDPRYFLRNEFLSLRGKINRELTYADPAVRDEDGRGTDLVLFFKDGPIVLFSAAPRADFI